jgi:hypothetical protein
LNRARLLGDDFTPGLFLSLRQNRAPRLCQVGFGLPSEYQATEGADAFRIFCFLGLDSFTVTFTVEPKIYVKRGQKAQRLEN